MDAWSWWMIAAVVLGIGELLILTIFILGPLAIAAAATAVAAALGAEIELQLAVFAAFSIIAVAALRPVAKRHRSAPPEILTNAAALIGKRARVLEPVERGAPGLVRLENENWSAEPAAGVPRLEPETEVRVVEISGATAIVEPLNGERP